MIKYIAGGQYINVMGGSTSYPYINMSNPSTGMLRYNGNNQNFEVYDGNSWMILPGNSSSVDLNNDAKELLEWTRAKRAEENYYKQKYKDNPAIQDLVKQREDIDSKISMITTILREEVKV